MNTKFKNGMKTRKRLGANYLNLKKKYYKI